MGVVRQGGLDDGVGAGMRSFFARSGGKCFGLTFNKLWHHAL
jgi:hypothetical protein